MRKEYIEYPSYKDSSVKWISLIPTDWHTRPIKFCVSTKVTDGPHETPTLVNEGIPFISAEAIKNNKIDFNKRRGNITKETDLVFSKKCKPQRDDVFLIKSGNTTGNAAMVETDIDFNIWSPLALMRANKEVMLPKFLLYAIRSISFQDSVKLFCSIGTQPNIGMNLIENLKVCVPSLTEQTQIAAFLDKKTAQIDKLINEKEKLLKLLAEKRTAIITQAVTKGLDQNVEMKDSGIDWLGENPKSWEVKALKRFAKICNGQDHKGVWDENGEFPILGSGGVFGKSTQYLHKGPSVLLGRKGTIDKPQDVTEPFWSVDTAYYTDIFENTYPKFFYYLTTTINFDLYKYGSAVPSMTQTDLGQIPFATPKKVEEQKYIADYLDGKVSEYMNLEGQITTSVNQLKEYREALITAAVTGQIDVRKEVVNE
jgi:type I restriction enzyme S subunit